MPSGDLRIERLGRVFGAEDGPDWMVSHAAYPAPVLLAPDHLRVFIVARDGDNRGAVGWIDVDPADPVRVTAVSPEPCLLPGGLGTFSDRGISIGCVLPHEGALWMYYMGWNKSADVPFRNAIGLAVDASGTGERFEPAFEGPLVDRSRFDPFTLSYPFVTPPGPGGGPGDGRWHMLYGTSRGGGTDEDQMHHVLTEAWSEDGIDWQPGGADVVGLAPDEFGLSRPWIVRMDGQEHLFHAIRRKQYSIGHAVRDPESENGAWQRLNADVLGPGTDAWEDSATCYPALIRAGGRLLMFYNGNGYGRTGLGVAVVDGVG